MVTFGKVARNVNINEKEPLKHGITRAVGLEHLDPCSLRITRWGEVTDEISFTRRFSKGQILFGKRRAYQRKAALAEFDGICSSDILVFEARSDVLIPELLPFIVQSDRFFEFAINTSSGSLSPRTKWKDLAAYTFPLPPIDEQCRIAEILWAAEDVIVKNEAFVAEMEHYKQLMMRDLFRKEIGHKESQKATGRKMVKIGLISEVKGGIQKTKNREPRSNPRRYLTVAHVQRNYIDSSDPRYFEVSDEELEIWRLLAGDVLVVEGNGNRELVGRTALFKGEIEDCVHQNHVIRVRPNQNSLTSEYLAYFLNSPMGQQSVNKQSMGTSGLFTLSVGRLKKTEVPLPSLPEQRQIAAILSSIDDAIAAARASVEASKALKMQLINQLLSSPVEGF